MLLLAASVADAVVPVVPIASQHGGGSRYTPTDSTVSEQLIVENIVFERKDRLIRQLIGNGKMEGVGGDCSEGLASVNHGSYTTREVRGMNWRSPRAGYGHMLFPTAADESELNEAVWDRPD